MPHCLKASNASHAKQKESKNLFTHVSPEISDGGSMYNDSSDESTGDKSSVSDTVDETDSNDENAPQALESLQQLFTVFYIPTRGNRCR